MRSKKPYVLPAFYKWILESQCTPIMVVDANHPNLDLPTDFNDDEELLFSVSPEAVRDFQISETKVEFKASFSGVIHFISLPIQSILAIYAEEHAEKNWAGYYFDLEDNLNEEEYEMQLNSRTVKLKSIDGINKDKLQPDLDTRKPILRLVE